MLEITRIREEKEVIIERLKIRNLDVTEQLNKILEVDKAWRTAKQELEKILAESNAIAKEIGMLFSQGKKDEATATRERGGKLKSEEKELTEKVNQLFNELTPLLYEIPNVPNAIVPNGNSDEENEVISESGTIPLVEKDWQPHWELAKKYDLIDFELGVKVTALINFFLDEARDEGYQEIIPPFVVNEASGYGTGQLPDKEGQMYHDAADNLFLIPTAEVPLTNMYRDVLLKETDFPIKLTGYTPCFRREAGSYGSDVRGLNRLHQFDKVEIVRIEHPNKSYEVLDQMVAYVQRLLTKLELPFRTLKLCGGDLGFTAALTFDLEVYSAAQEKWLEVSSISNFETYQANRLKLRFKDGEKKKHLAHTLNGSALALPRIMAALLENNQTKDGIKIPAALIPYTGFDAI